MDELDRMAEGSAPTPRIALRARTVAACLRGQSTVAASRDLGLTAKTVYCWVRSFAEHGPKGIVKVRYQEIPSVRHSLQLVSCLAGSPPPAGRDRWTASLLAEELGLPRGTVRKALAHGGLSLGRTDVLDRIRNSRSAEELAELERMADGGAPTPASATRAGAVLAVLRGEARPSVCRRYGMSDRQLYLLADSFANCGTAGIVRLTRGCGSISVGKARPLVRALAQAPPPAGHSRWTEPLMAAELGLPPFAVRNALAAEGIIFNSHLNTPMLMSSLSAEHLAVLERTAKGDAPSPQSVTWARALLAIRGGESLSSVARRLGVTRTAPYLWVRNFARLGPDWLLGTLPHNVPGSASGPAKPEAFTPEGGRADGAPPEGGDLPTPDRTGSGPGQCLPLPSLKEGATLMSQHFVSARLLAARSEDDLAELERMAGGRAPTPLIAARAGAVAAFVRGESRTAAGLRFGLTPVRVSEWASSFALLGPEGLLRKARPDTPAVLKARPLLKNLLGGSPPEGHSRWTMQLIAESLKTSRWTVKSALSAEGIRLRPCPAAASLLAERSEEDVAELRRMTDGRSHSPGVAVRARAVSAVLDGESSASVARRLGVSRTLVFAWTQSFAQHGPKGLERVDRRKHALEPGPDGKVTGELSSEAGPDMPGRGPGGR
jgi:transposase-like protein